MVEAGSTGKVEERYRDRLWEEKGKVRDRKQQVTLSGKTGPETSERGLLVKQEELQTVVQAWMIWDP